jgi:hypothetical protein
MPTFFSKVFSRGKDKDKKKGEEKNKGQLSPTSPTNKRLSTQSQHVVEQTKEKDEDKEKEKVGLALFRPKSLHQRTASQSSTPAPVRPAPSRRSMDMPQLKLELDLPGLKNGDAQPETGGIGLGFEGDADLRTMFVDSVVAGIQIDDATLGETKLSPQEALALMSACAKVIMERGAQSNTFGLSTVIKLISIGLDTLGIMHPHWHSASPAAQRRIIMLFVNSIASSTPSTPATPSPASAAFATELDYTRSPHDVAAVFRWALRHLKLDGGSFDGRTISTSSALSGPNGSLASLRWYDAFAANESGQSYPLQAFSELLLPQLPRSHADLLLATTGLMSSLSAHSEWNGVSGSKLAMLFGHYLLTGNRADGYGQSEWVKVQSDAGREGLLLEGQEKDEGGEADREDGWVRFYSQWERSGRALEHLFLAQLR